ncbi:MAG: DUF2807 domain-containing protein [Phaeodactylibacter sp.]|nr:DUF2807 domain-containing protein [Phaeodactylibacter sp.]MCB9275055.1 DUF2807 domain-containing protein [Lewinellaceae bacterium]
MKTISNVFLAGMFLLFAVAAYAQQDLRKLDYFDAISATGDIEVVLIAGENPSAAIYAEGIDVDDVSVYVKGKTLKLQLIEGLFHDNQRARVEVTYQQIRAIKASAGAKVHAEAPLNGDMLDLRAASGGYMELSVAVNTLNAYASEGGVIDIEGRTETQDVTAATGGRYQGLNLDCDRSFVKANTGGEAEVVANLKLDANANTGGAIHYKGDPEEKYTRTVIAGDIHKL